MMTGGIVHIVRFFLRAYSPVLLVDIFATNQSVVGRFRPNFIIVTRLCTVETTRQQNDTNSRTRTFSLMFATHLLLILYPSIFHRHPYLFCDWGTTQSFHFSRISAGCFRVSFTVSWRFIYLLTTPGKRVGWYTTLIVCDMLFVQSVRIKICR